VVIESFGTGSLAACAWAAEHPERIRGLYLDAPLIDLASLDPSRVDSQLPEPIRIKREKEWSRLLERLTPKSAERIPASPLNPMPKLEKLAAAKVPLLLVLAGDDYTVIPQKTKVSVAMQIYQTAHAPVSQLERPKGTSINFGLPSPAPLLEWVDHLEP
jgi:alpha-beta hydrolase superfamily lysophospholipase